MQGFDDTGRTTDFCRKKYDYQERMEHTITLPILDGILHRDFSDDIQLDKESFALLLEIQQELSIFEPMDDDEARTIWLEIPRGTATQWKSFEDANCGVMANEEDSLESYQEVLEAEFPYEKEWFFLVTSTYRENTFLKISDRVHRYVILTNRCIHEPGHPQDMAWFLRPLLRMVKERVATITKDPNIYNSHIEENLPYRQRDGIIKSKDINRIIPEQRFKVKNRKHCIQVMKELLRREQVYESVKQGTSPDWEALGVPAPFDTMTIRTFCHYYRIADTAYRSKSRKRRPSKVTEPKNDVEYYGHGIHSISEEYNLDSEEDFLRFATDHYGELGLSRMNVGGTQHYAGGKWLVTFGISYSAHDAAGLRIALALYETGAPFIFYDAENLLHILEETGTVRLSPFTFHDYLKAGDDEGVFALPFVEDCGKEWEITRTQYDEIVRLAEWEPVAQLKLNHPIPLEDPVYHLIREEVDSPLTLSEIRQRIEKKYDTYLSAYEDSDGSGYYYVFHDKRHKQAPKESKERFPTYNEALRALILKIQEDRPRKR